MLDDRYRLEAKLGEGGMGVVYRGVHVAIERPVAIKFLRPEYADNEEIATRFLLEARAAAKLRGDHVIEVLDFGKAPDGSLFFVMELLDGQPLSKVLQESRRLGAERAVEIAAQICVALESAHRNGIVHRDLKPANVVLLRCDDGRDHVKVLDFGVAKVFGDAATTLTQTGVLLGTVDFMAPEQILGRPVDPRTDVYALGVLLYRMLSGVKPFSGTGVPAMIYHHVNTVPDPLRVRAPEAGIPAALDDVVMRCLAKDPAQRFQDMGEVREALRAALCNDRGVRASELPELRPPDEPTLATVAERGLMSPDSRPPFDDPAHPDTVAPGDGTPARPQPSLEIDLDSSVTRLRPGRRTPVVLGGLAVGAMAAIALVLTSPWATPENEVPTPQLRASQGTAAPAPARQDEAAGDSAGEQVRAEANAAELAGRQASPQAEAAEIAGETVPTEAGPAAKVTETAEAPAADAPPGRPGLVTVTSSPTGGRVFVQGRLIGKAPASFRPSSFEPVVVRVVAKGRVPFEHRFVPTTGPSSIEAVLKRVRRRPKATPERPKPADPADGFLPLDL